ncbi:MAG: excinuclease ABC subunit UvrC [Labilithrix sp.]|nr:excinuclease ABC subunit UvrC [Labilithrix sp.]MCW5816940.1 excinuclease ABC subunit UvrC [Labilithrix sp.]
MPAVIVGTDYSRERNVLPDVVTEKLDALPVQSGVYLFKDKKGAVVYVGKAKSLRSRVRSYFQDGNTDNRYFIPLLQRAVGDLETIVTGSEKEAAILENNLIKEHRPRWNVKLRDDKDYISLKLDPKDEWARLWVVRRPSFSPKETARYFGPYHSATAARRTLHLVNKHFQLRTCTDTEMRARKRPCLQHQIKRCPAPCVLEVDRSWYDEQVRAVAMFLDGRHDELSRELDQRMTDAARAMRFELAAVYRDQLAAIEKVREEQRVVSVDDVDRDVLGLHREGDLVELALLHIRHGRLADLCTFSIKNAEVPNEEVVAAFLAQHYAASEVADEGNLGSIDAATRAARRSRRMPDQAGAAPAADIALPIPDEIIVPVLPDAATGTAEWLSERAKHKVALLQPQRGPRVDLLRLANENAAHAFNEKRRASDDVQERLTQLKERLRLPTVPRRIECCDISHLAGKDTVGAVVAMLDGEPDKKRYRTFTVKGGAGAEGASKAVDGAPTPGSVEEDIDGMPVHVAGDDYRAMYEVLARRFRRGLKKQEEGEGAEQEWDLPDLFVVDGGRGQLAVALAAARDLGLHELPIVALAKEKESVMGDTLVDRVYLPGQKNPIPLKSHSASMFFLARARDEAHRFSNRARERLGKKKRMRSALDDVAGIGPRTKQALLMHLGSLKAIKAATDDAILAVPGVTRRHLKALRDAFPFAQN